MTGSTIAAGGTATMAPTGGVATTAFSGSWYHEEAIQEVERARKI